MAKGKCGHRARQWAGADKNMGMFDVSDKPETLRIATARAIIKVGPKTILLINEGKSPKISP